LGLSLTASLLFEKLLKGDLINLHVLLDHHLFEGFKVVD